MANTTIKISQLPNIGGNLNVNALLPVVSTTNNLVTDKITVGNLANFILSEAGNTLQEAFVSTIAYTVVNADQPNITSVGTLNIDTLRILGGQDGYVIQTDGTGNLTWAAQPGAGTIAPGGTTGQVQFNNEGLFAGDPNLFYDAETSTLSAINVSAETLVGDGSNITNVAMDNITGLGNIAGVSLNGNASTILQGDGTFAAPPYANFVEWTHVPLGSTAEGTPGQAAYDPIGSLYICVAANTWAKFTGTTSW